MLQASLIELLSSWLEKIELKRKADDSFQVKDSEGFHQQFLLTAESAPIKMLILTP